MFGREVTAEKMLAVCQWHGDMDIITEKVLMYFLQFQDKITHTKIENRKLRQKILTTTRTPTEFH